MLLVLRHNFNYETGPFDNVPKRTPAKPWMIKANYNVNNDNKVTFRYNQLNSSTDSNHNGSGALGTTRQTQSTNFLTFANSNYAILENIKSGVGEWNSVLGSFTNQLIVGDTFNDESRKKIQLFPFVVIGDGLGSAYTAFGSEPFTPFNLLTYKQFQLQDSVTKVVKNHSWTFGGALEKFHSDNSFYFGIQSAYSYASLADFYTDANGFLANPSRTVSPVTLPIFQVKYLLQPGQTTPPLQPLDVTYSSVYGQDEWRARPNVTVTAGVRVDVPRFGDTAFDNPSADSLTFRDQDGSPSATRRLPGTTCWSPRAVNWTYCRAAPHRCAAEQVSSPASRRMCGFRTRLATRVSDGFDSRSTRVSVQRIGSYKPAATGGVAASYSSRDGSIPLPADVADQRRR